MPCSSITGVILAGGRASRMGGTDKGLIEMDGKPLIEHVLMRLIPQVSALLISANRNLADYARQGYPVIQDTLDGYLGPLAGVLSAMRVARTPYILTVPCDGPFIPANLAQRLLRGLQEHDSDIAVACDGKDMQPVVALLACTLADDIQHYLDSGQRKVSGWLEKHKPALVDFSDQPAAFININTPQERSAFEQQLNPGEKC